MSIYSSEEYLSSNNEENAYNDEDFEQTTSDSENAEPSSAALVPVTDRVQNHVQQGVPEHFKKQCEALFRELSSSKCNSRPQSPSSSSQNDMLRWKNKKRYPRRHVVQNEQEVYFQNKDFASILNRNTAIVSRNLRNEVRIPVDIFPWKHFFPKHWKNSLETFLKIFISKMPFCIFNLHVLEGEKWCFFNIMGTKAQIASAKSELLFFILTSMPRESKTIYVARKLTGNFPPCVLWDRFPYFCSKKNKNLTNQAYTLITSEEHLYPFLRPDKRKPYNHSAFLKDPRHLFQNLEHVYCEASLAHVIHQIHMYHLYFKKYYPFPSNCRLIGSLGKQVVASYQIRPPNSPRQPFPLNEIERRLKIGNITSNFTLNLWHSKQEIFHILTKAGFGLKRNWSVVCLDIPTLEGTHCMARAKWVKCGDHFTYKNCKVKDPVPMTLILNFAGLIYDLRIRLVYKISKTVEDIRKLCPSNLNILPPTCAVMKYSKNSSNTDPYMNHTEKWLFQHEQLPIQAKLYHISPSQRQDYFTLQFLLTMDIDHVMKIENWQLLLSTFLDVMCSVASAFPPKTI